MSLDPILQQLIAQIPALPPGPIDYPVVRAQADALIPLIVGPAGLPEVGSVRDSTVAGAGGPVPIRIYRPVGEVRGTLHYIHGGGWSMGNLAVVDPPARRLCRDLSMVVVTSTYRLAPENRFPAAYDDSVTASRWVLAHLDELGGDRLPAVIGGDSAGGNLTAAVCQALRDDPQGARPFDLQWLLYPAVDMRPESFEYASRRANADPSLRTEALHVCMADYLGPADPSDPRASPSAAGSLAGLPRALVVVLTVDPLRDEAVAYASALRAAGVEAELIEFPNLTHGFVHFAGIIPAAAVALGEVEQRLTKMLGIAG